MTPQTTFVNGISPWVPLNPLRAAWAAADNATLSYIAAHPTCTVREVADGLHEDPHAIRNRLRRLIKSGKLRLSYRVVESRRINLLEVVQ